MEKKISSDSEFLWELFSTRKIDLSTLCNQYCKKDVLQDEDLQQICSQIALNDEDLTKREIIRVFFESILVSNQIDCKIYSFGSTTSGLGTFDSDIDFHVHMSNTTKPKSLEKVSNHHYWLQQIHQLLRSCLKQYFRVLLIRANCPIVKMLPMKRFKQKNLINCDLNITNPFGIYNSIFINHLCQLCPRFKQITILLRIFAKQNDLICPEAFNSYTFTILIIFFFQDRGIFSPTEQLKIDFTEHYFKTEPEDFRSLIAPRCAAIVHDNSDKSSILELMVGFFRFYSRFDYVNHVISVRLGKFIFKSDFESNVVQDHYPFNMNIGVCVEDPFELERNISKNCSMSKLEDFISLCDKFQRKGKKYLSSGVNFRQIIATRSLNNPLHSKCSLICPCICRLREFQQSVHRDRDQDYLFESFLGFQFELVHKILMKMKEKPFSIGAYNFSLKKFDTDWQNLSANLCFDLKNNSNQMSKKMLRQARRFNEMMQQTKSNVSNLKNLAQNRNIVDPTQLPGPSNLRNLRGSIIEGNVLGIKSGKKMAKLENPSTLVKNKTSTKQNQSLPPQQSKQNPKLVQSSSQIQTDSGHPTSDKKSNGKLNINHKFTASLVSIHCGNNFNFGYLQITCEKNDQIFRNLIRQYIEKACCTCTKNPGKRKYINID